MGKEKDLEKFQELENSKQNKENLADGLNQAADLEQEETGKTIQLTEIEKLPKEKKLKKAYNIIEGFRTIDKNNLPFGGVFYPASWEFAYRCPTTEEVANFSTITEGDQPKIINAITELIKKCFVVIDRVAQKEIPSGSINDGERLYFFLKLREFYMHDKPIEYVTMSQEYNEAVTVNFVADSLQFKTPSQGLLNCFDGRKFTFIDENLEEPIKFLMPTLDLGSRIFRYVTKSYQEAQKETSDNIKNQEAFNKNFLFVAPYLFETGNETIESLKVKYQQICKNSKKLDTYIQIINLLNITNEEKIKYTYKESEEEALMKFPGGWKHIFINKKAFGGIFN